MLFRSKDMPIQHLKMTDELKAQAQEAAHKVVSDMLNDGVNPANLLALVTDPDLLNGMKENTEPEQAVKRVIRKDLLAEAIKAAHAANMEAQKSGDPKAMMDGRQNLQNAVRALTESASVTSAELSNQKNKIGRAHV